VTEMVFRLGLIGAGRMGQTHLRALAGSTAVSVTAVFEEVAQLLDAGNIDGVLIAAPSDRHLQLVTQVAAAGLPILCEKPCGLSSDEVRRAALATEQCGVPIQVGFWRRYVTALQALRGRIERRELGDIHLLASYQWDGQPPSALFRAHSGGIFRDMGVHEFDQIRWLSGQELGEVSAVAAPLIEVGTGQDVDSAQAIAPLSGGATAFVSLGRYFPGGDMARIEVFGSLDAVRCDFLDPTDGEQAQLDALVRQAEGFATYARGGPLTGASIHDAAAALVAAERAAAAILPLRPIVWLQEGHEGTQS
jgi:myo-inositol 2-dehydrogenase/D-chiro-inositol 1-dehydrogenase